MTPERKTEILTKIVSLDITKIRYYFAKLQKVQSTIPDIERFLPQLASNSSLLNFNNSLRG